MQGSIQTFMKKIEMVRAMTWEFHWTLKLAGRVTLHRNFRHSLCCAIIPQGISRNSKTLKGATLFMNKDEQTAKNWVQRIISWGLIPIDEAIVCEM